MNVVAQEKICYYQCVIQHNLWSKTLQVGELKQDSGNWLVDIDYISQ
jgi:hypothetical protein